MQHASIANGIRNYRQVLFVYSLSDSSTVVHPDSPTIICLRLRHRGGDSLLGWVKKKKKKRLAVNRGGEIELGGGFFYQTA